MMQSAITSFRCWGPLLQVTLLVGELKPQLGEQDAELTQRDVRALIVAPACTARGITQIDVISTTVLK